MTGSLRSAIGRGQPPGMSPYDLGSTLDYYVSVAPSTVPSTNTVGAFDGFMNGFSSDQRTFYVTKQVSIYGTPSTPQSPDGTSGTIGKSVGTVGAAGPRTTPSPSACPPPLPPSVPLPSSAPSSCRGSTPLWAEGPRSPSASCPVPRC